MNTVGGMSTGVDTFKTQFNAAIAEIPLTRGFRILNPMGKRIHTLNDAFGGSEAISTGN